MKKAYRRPLNSCFDFSKRWQNSETTILLDSTSSGEKTPFSCNKRSTEAMKFEKGGKASN